ncbi:MAG: hypothetical protein IT373_09595 [Polyangiaceae bacterium]|nr:hypothetical protein [Polyangiaceae bacterium]
MARRVTRRERTAYHEAGHLVAWCSAPFEPPAFGALTIEPGTAPASAGELRVRAGKLSPATTDPWVHRLHVGRALGKGSLPGLALALSEALAHVRVDAAGLVCESLLTGLDLASSAPEHCDYWTAYELASALGLDPEDAWRREWARAREWLGRRSADVTYVARWLLARPRGAGTISGAALRAVVRSRLPEPSALFGAHRYQGLARRLLRDHRARLDAARCYGVVQLVPEAFARATGTPRELPVYWDRDESGARQAARALQALPYPLSAWGFAVRRLRPLTPTTGTTA